MTLTRARLEDRYFHRMAAAADEEAQLMDHLGVHRADDPPSHPETGATVPTNNVGCAAARRLTTNINRATVTTVTLHPDPQPARLSTGSGSRRHAMRRAGSPASAG